MRKPIISTIISLDAYHEDSASARVLEWIRSNPASICKVRPIRASQDPARNDWLRRRWHQSIRSAGDTVIPSGPRTQAMRHMRLALANYADSAAHAVAVRGQPVGGRLKIVDLEGHVAQTQLVSHHGGRGSATQEAT